MRRSNQGGFTIIELMITIGVMGLLVTLAIPSFITFQLRTKASEARSNIGAIVVAEEAYFGEYGAYPSATPVPNTVTNRKRMWPLAPNAPHGFNSIGFKVQGSTYFQYAVASAGTAFTIGAQADLDGNGQLANWGYVKADVATALGVLGPFGVCPGTGVYDASSGANDDFDSIGPCNGISGTTEY